jgi:iron complex transport system permease protein
MRLGIVLLLALLACVIVGIVGLFVGSSGQIGWAPSESIRDIRQDRVMLAMLVGALLSGAGVAYQAALKNELAEPFLLGVASGAGLASYLWIYATVSGIFGAVVGVGIGVGLVMAGQFVFSFIGAMLAVVVVLGVTRIRQTHSGDDSSTLILTGVVISTICGAAILTLSQLMRAIPGMVGVDQLLVGGIRTETSAWAIGISAVILLLGFVYMLWHVISMNLLTLGDEQATSMGLETSRARMGLLAIASLMASAAVALAGPIGFIGLICPHAARRIVGSDHRLLLPASVALGAMLLTLADALSRLLAGENWLGQMLPVGVITAIVGGPVFLLLLAKQGRRS